jgi:hypothetical protein
MLMCTQRSSLTGDQRCATFVHLGSRSQGREDILLPVMASTLALLAHDSVRAVVGLKDAERQELALVFKNVFDDRGNEFCVDFDIAWKWIGYSLKHHALHRLKTDFKEGRRHH